MLVMSAYFDLESVEVLSGFMDEEAKDGFDSYIGSSSKESDDVC